MSFISFISPPIATADSSVWVDKAMQFEPYLIWLITLAVVAFILVKYIKQFRKMERVNLFTKREAVELQIDQPPAQHPMIDLNLCIGCGSCVDACPEGGVLALVSGKATIVNGLRCVGHGKCAEACPVEAVKIGLGDLSQREDIPRMSPSFQSNIPGVYIVGELGGLALIKNAINQSRQAVEAIARDMRPGGEPSIYDIVIVGAGPAGMSAALAAKQKNFSCIVIEQEKAGGAILHYPRKKMMLTQPVEIPLFGWLKKSMYSKEELLAIWESIIEKNQIEILQGVALSNLERRGETIEVLTSKGVFQARRVLLALGRRGSPRKLGAPGEELGKVMYKLMDAGLHQNEKLLVVGGGDSAVEAAIALSRQSDNVVTVSYRKHKFFRIKKRNLELLDQAIAQKRIEVLYNSNVVNIGPDHVSVKAEDGLRELPNDYVFIFAGGIPPFGLLKKIGIAFGAEAA